MSDIPKSTLAIARLLDSEGFSDHTANVVEKYWKHNLMDEQRRARVERTEEAFAEFAGPLSASQKIILGKWIGLHKKLSFDVGIRIGLMAFAIRNARDVVDGSEDSLPEYTRELAAKIDELTRENHKLRSKCGQLTVNIRDSAEATRIAKSILKKRLRYT